MIKRITLADRIVTALVESAVIALYILQHISESTAVVLALLALVFLFSSTFSSILPEDVSPNQDDKLSYGRN